MLGLWLLLLSSSSVPLGLSSRALHSPGEGYSALATSTLGVMGSVSVLLLSSRSWLLGLGSRMSMLPLLVLVSSSRSLHSPGEDYSVVAPLGLMCSTLVLFSCSRMPVLSILLLMLSMTLLMLLLSTLLSSSRSSSKSGGR